MTLDAEIGSVGLLLILRAFASGSTALTGIEAIADGVPAFRTPKAHNAASTLSIMAAMSITMFLGITVLARLIDVRVTEHTIDELGSVLSQIGRAVFGQGGALRDAPGSHDGDPGPGRQHRLSGLPEALGNPRHRSVDASPDEEPAAIVWSTPTGSSCCRWLRWVSSSCSMRRSPRFDPALCSGRVRQLHLEPDIDRRTLVAITRSLDGCVR